MQGLRLDVRRHGPLLLLAVLLLAPVLAIPNTGDLVGVKTFLLQTAAFGLLGLLLAQVRWSPEGIKRFALTGPNLAIVGLVTLATVSFFLAAPAAGRGRDIALMDVLRLASGAVVFFAVMYKCGTRDRSELLTSLVLGGGVLAGAAAIFDYAVYGSFAQAAMGNKQLLGAFLLLLLPFCAIFALNGEMGVRRIVATVASVGLVGGLLLTQNRASWLGALVGLAVVGLLSLRGSGFQLLRRPVLMVPALAAIVVLGGVLASSQLGGDIAGRLATAHSDGDLTWRQQVGSAAVKMIAEKPLGWGNAGFALNGSRYSALVAPAAKVEAHGLTMQSMVHNEYLQIGVGLGLLGLALYLLVLGGFFVRGVKALSRIESDRRRWLLIGAMGAVAAQMVDALGNPAWQYSEVSLPFWLMLGLGMAASRTHRERGEVRELAPAAAPGRPSLGRLGWQGLAAVVVVGLAAASFAGGVGSAKGSAKRCYDEDAEPNLVIKPARFADTIRLESHRVGRGRFRRFETATATFRACNIRGNGDRPEECSILGGFINLIVPSAGGVNPPFGPLNPFQLSSTMFGPVMPGQCSQPIRVSFTPSHTGRFFATIEIIAEHEIKYQIDVIGIARRR
jgi:O-antigen ligase